jgi:uncharacterized protein (TIGR02145 family)
MSIKVKGQVVIGASPYITINDQTWTRGNASVIRYRNGDPIPQITDGTEWENATYGAWCYYDNDPANELFYGKIYNGYAITDPRGLAPVGWQIPSISDWQTLYYGVGDGQTAAAALKEVGTTYWNSPNTGATNSSRFSARGGGAGYPNNFFSLKTQGYWWSTTVYSTIYLTSIIISNNSTSISETGTSLNYGQSVRFLKL